jgi:hypothetical protein
MERLRFNLREVLVGGYIADHVLSRCVSGSGKLFYIFPLYTGDLRIMITKLTVCGNCTLPY